MRHAHAHWHSRIHSHSHWHSHSQRDVSKTCKCSKERKGHVLRVLCQCCKTFGLVTLAHTLARTHIHTQQHSDVCYVCRIYCVCNLCIPRLCSKCCKLQAAKVPNGKLAQPRRRSRSRRRSRQVCRICGLVTML